MKLNLCDLCLFTASLSTIFFAYLSEYIQSDCGFSHLETSKYRVITKEMTEIKHVLLSHGVTYEDTTYTLT
jgi:hypothetical protein